MRIKLERTGNIFSIPVESESIGTRIEKIFVDDYELSKTEYISHGPRSVIIKFQSSLNVEAEVVQL